MNTLRTSNGIDVGLLAECGRRADEQGTFPHESLKHLADLKLLSAAVSTAHGGLGLPAGQLVEIAAELGGACLSTALIWSMHSQQVNLLQMAATPTIERALQAICERSALVASVTTEYGKGGDIFTANAEMHLQDGLVHVRRKAPIVSYGALAEYYLVLMRDATPTGQSNVDYGRARFILASREQGTTTVDGAWLAMGVRGTQSIPMSFDMRVPADCLLAGDHRTLMLKHYAPMGQLLWAASWYGAAAELVRAFVRSMREGNGGLSKLLSSEVQVARIAEIRIGLFAMKSCLDSCSNRLDANGSGQGLRELEHSVQDFNCLKVFVSETSATIAGRLQCIAGLARGYLSDRDPPIERVVRDLSSARLMFSNDALITSIGTTEIARARR